MLVSGIEEAHRTAMGDGNRFVGIDGDEVEKNWRFILYRGIFAWRDEVSAGHRERHMP